MAVRFPSDLDVNVTDFDILYCLYVDGSLWKMEITRRVNAIREGRELVKNSRGISKQAVSRRVERLHELGFIDQAIVSTSDRETDANLNKMFIQGYAISGKGKEVLLSGTIDLIAQVIDRCIRDKVVEGDVGYLLEVYGMLKEDVEDASLVSFIREELDPLL